VKGSILINKEKGGELDKARAKSWTKNEIRTSFVCDEVWMAAKT